MKSVETIIDKGLKPGASAIGMPVAQVRNQVIGEAIGVGGEFVTDMLLRGIWGKGVQVGVGAILLGIIALAKKLPTSLRQTLFQAAVHLIGRIADPTPEKLQEIAQSVSELFNLKLGVTNPADMIFRQGYEFSSLSASLEALGEQIKSFFSGTLSAPMLPAITGESGNTVITQAFKML